MPGLTVTPQHELKVGSPDRNFVSFEITATEVTKKLLANITIPCGEITPGKTYLCADGKVAKALPRSEPADKLKFMAQARKKETLSWKSDTFSLNAGEKVTIRITGFNPEREGNAKLDLKITNPNPLHDQPYTVSIAPAPGFAIIYFDVSPTNVLQGKEVTISSTTTGAQTVKLYAGGHEVQVKSSEKNQIGAVNKYTHKPQETTTYVLKAWQGQPGSDDQSDAAVGKLAQREVTVAVAARPGWYSWDLLTNSLPGADVGKHFYPTLLLNAKDLSGEAQGDLLYGIFVCKETKQAGLWSSSSGVDGWRWEADVPEGMGESPGVIYKQALWLIGGSSADPLGPVSNRVCWYYKNKNNEMVWNEWDEDGSVRRDPQRVPAPRRCHACAVFNDKIWVLGGLSEQNKTLDDVWTCSADPAGGTFTAAWAPSQPLPSGRCLSAVAATPGKTARSDDLVKQKMGGVNQPRLWLYGGATHPYNLDETFNELLWTQDGRTWANFALPADKKKKPLIENPLGATLLYGSDGYLHLAGVFRGGGDQTSDHTLNDASLDPPYWPKGSLSEFGWPIKTDLFLIRSVSFQERWIFWPVYQDWADIENYRARIYIP
jgi:hypothetical protein